MAAELSRQGRSVFVFDRELTFGQGISSRQSEIIHAGIYYPQGSLKAKLCREGNRLLYELCRKYDIPHKRTGKMIVACSEEEIPELERIYEQAAANGVDDLRYLSRADIQRLEPNVDGRAGILSPSTGIIDTHSLMSLFHSQAVEAGAEFLYGTEVTGLDRAGEVWRVGIRDREGFSELFSRVVINSAGLESDKVARLAGATGDDYRLHYCKGEYFGLNSRLRGSIGRLIYPTPQEAGLGVHLTIALDGMMRLGPNTQYVGEIDYSVDKSHREAFYLSAGRFLPHLELEDLHPDLAGIRPKLQGPGGLFHDFVIVHDDQGPLAGLVNLVGIESPGLTASPAIARYVAELTADIT
ncbi:MAG: NAD(P)/FAD-dependent oxidoreductase [Dehalococcoidia bacterium]